MKKLLSSQGEKAELTVSPLWDAGRCEGESHCFGRSGSGWIRFDSLDLFF
ncbi:MAG: hypothetical protein LLG09_08465 [Negativicutes bacterium]|nr:hypothetical protein [Negativicutes bacterium]